MQNDHEVMRELHIKLNYSSFGSIKDLSLRFPLCYKKRCSVLNSVDPCRSFFKDLFKERKELSLTDLQNDIEKGGKVPNRMVFKKIKEDISNGLVSMSLDSTFGDLNKDSKIKAYIENSIVYNLIPDEGTLLPTWKNVGSCHGYTIDELNGFYKQVRIGETAIQRLLSLISAEGQSLPISEFVRMLELINRNDLVIVVKKWLDTKMVCFFISSFSFYFKKIFFHYKTYLGRGTLQKK